eukprot:SAG11_NODE_1864_length_4154_cov_1.816769_3_plen_104_part_00
MQTGPLGKPVETFASRRQSVLAATNRRASLIGGIGNVMAGLGGGGSEADMMAAAVAAIDMEDNFDDAVRPRSLLSIFLWGMFLPPITLHDLSTNISRVLTVKS